MIFVDTSAWFAAYIATDRDHARVKPLIDGAATRLVTSNFVLAECLNLFRARNENQRAQALGRDLLAHNIAEVIEVTSTDLEKAFIAFSTYQDKSWSFTDCTSLVVMKRLGIGQAIALDYHFGQMPGVTLYP